jgi:tripartite-type tricarboxylate transporter receptor subunit TctC
MAARLGRSIIVENRTGAGGNIGMENVVRSAADGSTLMVADASSGMSVNEHIYRNMKFSPAKDLTGVALIGSTPHAVFISPQLPVKSLAELVAYARERKGELTYGSSGAGSPGHLNGGAFTKALGIDPGNHGSDSRTPQCLGRTSARLPGACEVGKPSSSGGGNRGTGA